MSAEVFKIKTAIGPSQGASLLNSRMPETDTLKLPERRNRSCTKERNQNGIGLLNSYTGSWKLGKKCLYIVERKRHLFWN